MPEMDAVDAETVGELLGSGVTKDDLIETQQTLERFRATSHDAFGEEQDWIRTALAAVVMARTEFNTEVPMDHNTDTIEYEYRCFDCGHESKRDEKVLAPECPECDDGRLHHVGPKLDECDKCGQGLLYRGNSGLGDDTLCDGCYEDIYDLM